jgi:Spy/CpxP family protein refolding chaperone
MRRRIMMISKNLQDIRGYEKGVTMTMKRSVIASILFLIFIDLIFIVLITCWATDASPQMAGWMSPGMNPGMMRGRENPGMVPGPQGMRREESPSEQIPDDAHHLWGNLKELALDEKQKQELKEISNRVMKEMIKKRTDEQITGIEMKELLDKDPVDLKAVEKKLKEIEAIKSEKQLTLIKAGEEVKSILTPNLQSDAEKGTHDERAALRTV